VRGAGAPEVTASLWTLWHCRNKFIAGFEPAKLPGGSARSPSTAASPRCTGSCVGGKAGLGAEATDVDDVVAELVHVARAVTRLITSACSKQFFAYLEARHAPEVEASFGLRIGQPVDQFHAGRHVRFRLARSTAPPTPGAMEEFFRLPARPDGDGTKWAPAARDYALFRSLSRRAAFGRGGGAGAAGPAFRPGPFASCT